MQTPPRVLRRSSASVQNDKMDRILELMQSQHAEVQQTMAAFSDKLAARDHEIAARFDQADIRAANTEARIISM